MAKKPQADWASIPVKHLGLTTRAYNAVTRGAGVKTIGHLAVMSDDALRHCPGMGVMTLHECRAAVRRFMTERGAYNDITSALTRASIKAGFTTITPSEGLAIIEALAQEGWEIRRV